MPVIAVFNQKGGVGKTTTTLNLAALLARGRQRPIVIDLDPQAHLTLSLGVQLANGSESVAAFFRGEKSLADLMITLDSGIRLIPAHQELSKIDALLAKGAGASTRLKQGLRESCSEEKVPVLIDCCPMLGVLTLNAVLAADRVLVPVSADFLSMHGTHRLDAALRALEGLIKRPIERRVVVTRFDARRRMAHLMVDRLREHLGRALLNTRIGENVSLAESPMHGRDIFAHDPRSQGASDYLELAKELTRVGFFRHKAAEGG